MRSRQQATLAKIARHSIRRINALLQRWLAGSTCACVQALVVWLLALVNVLWLYCLPQRTGLVQVGCR